jgi:hypothetical protein
MRVLGYAALVLALAGAGSAMAQQASRIQKCEVCHGKPDFKKVLANGQVVSLHVDMEEFRASVHGERRCEECHADITEIPHQKHGIQKVRCVRCHFQGNPVGAPGSDIVESYRQSVHGREMAAGNPKAPSCQGCHGAHDIRKRDEAESRTTRLEIPKTCGRCHIEIYAEYRTSVHGVGAADGDMRVPVCTTCHGEHDIQRHEDAASRVSPLQVSVTCSTCHSAEPLMERYGISSEQVATYSESFHGIANRFGMETVANCSSCHGIHDIRSHADPLSAVHPENLPATCGRCHPGANANFARGRIHVNPKSKDAGIIFYVAQFFKWLTIITLTGLALHILLDLTRIFLNRRGTRAAGDGHE